MDHDYCLLNSRNCEPDDVENPQRNNIETSATSTDVKEENKNRMIIDDKKNDDNDTEVGAGLSGVSDKITASSELEENGVGKKVIELRDDVQRFSTTMSNSTWPLDKESTSKEFSNVTTILLRKQRNAAEKASETDEEYDDKSDNGTIVIIDDSDENFDYGIIDDIAELKTLTNDIEESRQTDTIFEPQLQSQEQVKNLQDENFRSKKRRPRGGRRQRKFTQRLDPEKFFHFDDFDRTTTGHRAASSKAIVGTGNNVNYNSRTNNNNNSSRSGSNNNNNIWYDVNGTTPRFKRRNSDKAVGQYNRRVNFRPMNSKPYNYERTYGSRMFARRNNEWNFDNVNQGANNYNGSVGTVKYDRKISVFMLLCTHADPTLTYHDNNNSHPLNQRSQRQYQEQQYQQQQYQQQEQQQYQYQQQQEQQPEQQQEEQSTSNEQADTFVTRFNEMEVDLVQAQDAQRKDDKWPDMLEEQRDSLKEKNNDMKNAIQFDATMETDSISNLPLVDAVESAPVIYNSQFHINDLDRAIDNLHGLTIVEWTSLLVGNHKRNNQTSQNNLTKHSNDVTGNISDVGTYMKIRDVINGLCLRKKFIKLSREEYREKCAGFIMRDKFYNYRNFRNLVSRYSAHNLDSKYSILLLNENVDGDQTSSNTRNIIWYAESRYLAFYRAIVEFVFSCLHDNTNNRRTNANHRQRKPGRRSDTLMSEPVASRRNGDNATTSTTISMSVDENGRDIRNETEANYYDDIAVDDNNISTNTMDTSHDHNEPSPAIVANEMTGGVSDEKFTHLLDDEYYDNSSTNSPFTDNRRKVIIVHRLPEKMFWILDNLKSQFDLRYAINVEFVKLNVAAPNVRISQHCKNRENHTSVTCEICLFESYFTSVRLNPDFLSEFGNNIE